MKISHERKKELQPPGGAALGLAAGSVHVPQRLHMCI